MSHVQPPSVQPAPALAAWLSSDDDGVRKMAMLLEHRETRDLDEVVALIGRLGIAIE